MRKVVSSAGRIIDSSGLCAPTMLSIKTLLQKPVRTGLERIRPPRYDLEKESATSVRQEINLEPHNDPEMPRGRPPFKRLKKDRRDANLALEDMSLHEQDNTAYGTYIPCQALENETTTMDWMRKVKVCHEIKAFVVGRQRPMFLMPTNKVEVLRMPTEGDVELPGAYYPGPLADTIEQDDGAADGAAKKGPTAEEIDEPTVKKLAAKNVEEMAILRDVPMHSASDDPGDNFPDGLREPEGERNKVAGRGPGKLLANVVALEDFTADDSNNHSLKDTSDSRNLSNMASQVEVI